MTDEIQKINIDKLITYRERTGELADLNPMWKRVSSYITEDGTIIEEWRNGNTDRFHSIEFPLLDIDRINEKLRQKIIYRRDKIKA